MEPRVNPSHPPFPFAPASAQEIRQSCEADYAEGAAEVPAAPTHGPHPCALLRLQNTGLTAWAPFVPPTPFKKRGARIRSQLLLCNLRETNQPSRPPVNTNHSELRRIAGLVFTHWGVVPRVLGGGPQVT